MATAFKTAAADFSGTRSDPALFFGDIFHRATVSVDEEGTEAVAASAEALLRGMPSPKVVTMDINRPFIFLTRARTVTRERQSG